MHDLDRKLGTLFNDIARFRRTLFDQLATDYDLTHVQVFLLNYLHMDDGLTQTELAARMDIGTVTVSGLIDRLESKGYVERRPCVKDRRAKRVWLTSKMQEVWHTIGESLRHMNEITFAGVEDAEIEQLIRTLRKAHNNLQSCLSGKGAW
jgi:DNA-binding MarR family transcriptional regulator